MPGWRVRAGVALLIAALGVIGSPVMAEQALPAFVLPASLNLPDDYRQHWQKLSDASLSGLHWNQVVVLYSNTAGEDYAFNQERWREQRQNAGWTSTALPLPEYRAYPEGTVLIKESFARQSDETLTPAMLAIMIKRAPGFDAEHGDWEYLQTTATGDIVARGAASDKPVADVCGGCHQGVAERDFVFATTGFINSAANN